MKRTALLFLLAGLVIVELFLLEVFIPYGWHHPMSELMDRFFPGQPYEPHAHMDLEIEMVLSHHQVLRIVLYLVTGVLATGNALLISKVWKAWRRSKHPLAHP